MGYDGTLKFDTKVDTSGFGKGISEITGISQSGYEKTTKAFLGVTAGVAAIGTAAVKTASDFDAEMSKVSAISGATGEDFDALRDKAREMGSKKKFSASESAEAMEYMAMAGWKTEDMLEGIEGIMNLAAASGEDLGTTSDIVTDALTAFGLSAQDSGHFADILAAASSNANTNVSMLGESFKYVAPVAGSLGMSAEDTSVALGLMANSGIKASQAGTALRSILTRMAKPTKQSQAALDALGLSLTDEQGNVKDLATLMGDMREAFSHCTDAEKAQYAALLAGQEGMSGLLAIVNASEADYNKLTGAIENCDGSAEDMALTMQDNLQGQLTILKSALEELAISIGDTLVPTIRKIVGVIQGWVDKFNSLDDGTKEMIVKIGLFVAAIGPVLLTVAKVVDTVIKVKRAFSAVKTAVTAVIPAFKALGAAMMANPIVLIIAAIAALVVAFIYLWNTSEEFRNFWIGLWEKIKGAVSTAWEAIKGFFTAAWEFIKSIPERVTEFVTGIWEKVTEFFTNLGTSIVTFFTELPGKVVEFFTTLITTVVEWLANLGQNIATFLSELPYKIGYALGVVIGNIIQFGIDVVNWVVTNVPLIIESIVTFFAELPGKIWTWLVTTVQNIAQWGLDCLAWVAETVPQIIENIVTFFSELPGKIWTWLVDAFNKVVQWGKDTLDNAKQAASDTIDAIVDFFSQLPGKIWDWLTDTIDKVIDFGSDLVDKGKEAAQDFFDGIIDIVTGLPGEMLSIGADIVNGVWQGIQNAAGTFWNNVTNFFSGIVDGVKDTLGIGSPSKVFAKEVGQWIPPGTGEGFKDSMPELRKTMTDEMTNLVDDLQTTVDAETSKISFNKTGAQEYDRAQAERQSQRNVTVSGRLEGDRPIEMHTNLYLDKRKFAEEITPAVNHEMYKIDKTENNRGRGN